MPSDEGRRFSRATALGFLGGSAATLAACGATGVSSLPALSAAAASGSPSPSASPSAAAVATTSGSCAASPEGEIGPYFADDSLAGFNRSNLLTNIDGSSPQTGVPFTLTLLVVDTNAACAPMSGVQIDVWHCNTAGVYSDESSQGTATQSWLRGYQVTGAAGTVTFTTIVPGWYQGRTTHIHIRARSKYNSASSTSDGSNTTQLFFPQTLVDTLATSVAPYSTEGKNPTTNASDRVYTTQTNGKMLLTPTGSSTSGYAASFTIGLPIT